MRRPRQAVVLLPPSLPKSTEGIRMRDGVFSDAAGLPPELQAVQPPAVQVPGPASVEVEVEVEPEVEPEVEGSATASAAAEIEAGPAVETETETETEAETAEPGLLQQEPTKHSARPEQMPHLPAGNTVS